MAMQIKRFGYYYDKGQVNVIPVGPPHINNINLVPIGAK